MLDQQRTLQSSCMGHWPIAICHGMGMALLLCVLSCGYLYSYYDCSIPYAASQEVYPISYSTPPPFFLLCNSCRFRGPRDSVHCRPYLAFPRLSCFVQIALAHISAADDQGHLCSQRTTWAWRVQDMDVWMDECMDVWMFGCKYRTVFSSQLVLCCTYTSRPGYLT
jgi:hypothetical protein